MWFHLVAKFATNVSGAMLSPSLIKVTESISGSVVPLAMFFWHLPLETCLQKHQYCVNGCRLTSPWEHPQPWSEKEKTSQPQNLKLRHSIDFDNIKNYVSVIAQSVFDLCLHLSFLSALLFQTFLLGLKLMMMMTIFYRKTFSTQVLGWLVSV